MHFEGHESSLFSGLNNTQFFTNRMRELHRNLYHARMNIDGSHYKDGTFTPTNQISVE